MPGSDLSGVDGLTLGNWAHPVLADPAKRMAGSAKGQPAAGALAKLPSPGDGPETKTGLRFLHAQARKMRSEPRHTTRGWYGRCTARRELLALPAARQRVRLALVHDAKPRKLSSIVLSDFDDAGRSRNTDAFAERCADLCPQQRRRAHVFALHDVDRVAMWPANVAQVSPKRRRGSASRWILKDTANREGVAAVKFPRRLDVEEVNRGQTLVLQPSSPLPTSCWRSASSIQSKSQHSCNGAGATTEG